ncbi:MAG: hypothetical protein P8129_17765 [Anaerolineae bacterium]|jgi:hypothetical protein
MKICRWLLLGVSILALAGCANSSATAQETGWISPLPTGIKGYELYSWRPAGSGLWHYALMTGTNRLKTFAEVTVAADDETEAGWVKLTAVGLDELKVLLRRLPARATVAWRSEGWLADSPSPEETIRLPEDRILSQVRAYCRQFGIDLTIADRPPGQS